MSEIAGKAGHWELFWKSVPHGPSGSARLKLADGKQLEVRWKRDADGLWIELPHGTYGFDLTAERDSEQDDGRATWSIRQRGMARQWVGAAFVRAGEESTAAAGGAVKKNVRVRAQMPGKIIRIMAKAGDAVEKNQPLLVMEAMKMENEIRAPQAGRIGSLKVTEGQAVETGADLCLIDPA